MKKGSNAAETVRDGVAGLWRKGANMKWSVPAGADKAAVGKAFSCHCRMAGQKGMQVTLCYLTSNAAAWLGCCLHQHRH